jgi:hypothetical protein
MYLNIMGLFVNLPVKRDSTTPDIADFIVYGKFPESDFM